MLMRAPGLSPVVALTYRACVDKPARFQPIQVRRSALPAHAATLPIGPFLGSYDPTPSLEKITAVLAINADDGRNSPETAFIHAAALPRSIDGLRPLYTPPGPPDDHPSLAALALVS